MNKTTYVNTGYGPRFSVLEIGLDDKVAVVEGDSGFWAIVDAAELPSALSGKLTEDFLEKEKEFKEEMELLRFKLPPSAVYFNPTDRCNFDCTYCYLPRERRKNGISMSAEEVCSNLEKLLLFFREVLGDEAKPQVIFHGAEPMMVKDAVFEGISRYKDDFLFGIQTNGTLLTDEDLEFIKKNQVGLGISLDAPVEEIADTTRKSWSGKGGFKKVVEVIEKLSDYPAYNVITTVTKFNVSVLKDLIKFYYDLKVPVIMLNPVRCTQEGGRLSKPDDMVFLKEIIKALDLTYELYKSHGRKLVVANFANIMAGILGPTGRRLMCDISPCGGGRCFFALAANGDIFPCSEFIGIPEFKAGNINEEPLSEIMKKDQIKMVTSRMVENIDPCKSCAVRHFCGAPCPAEVYMLNGDLNTVAPFCNFYEGLIRYAFKVIAEGKENSYMWDGWEEETECTYNFA